MAGNAVREHRVVWFAQDGIEVVSYKVADGDHSDRCVELRVDGENVLSFDDGDPAIGPVLSGSDDCPARPSLKAALIAFANAL